MKTKLHLLLIFCFSLAINSSFAQEIKDKTMKPIFHTTVDDVKVVPSLASRSDLIPAPNNDKEAQDGRSRASKHNAIIGKGTKVDDALAKSPHYLKNKIQGRMPLFDFEAAASTAQPTDPTAAVGPNHYMVSWNSGFKVFDKTGTDLTGPLSYNNIFSAGACCDMTISYDNAADRWVVSVLYVGNGVEVAVSDGPNPVTANWFVYTISSVVDYNKISVWHDGYYLTDNNPGTPVYALERDEMLLGNPAAQVLGFGLPGLAFNFPFMSAQAFNVTNGNMPTTGGCPVVFLQDDAFAGVTQDHIKLWTINVDWVTPGNSSSDLEAELGIDAGTGTVTPFISVFDGGSFVNLAQPTGGTSVDAVQHTVMNQAQFRKFGGHNSAVFNFTVDTDGGAGELAGVRWYELRQSSDGQPWSIFQEGTYTAPDGRHAWMASMAMDLQGNIGLGYTSMSGPTTPSTVRIGSYYTGRFANDPLGTMNITEEVIKAGDANIPSTRFCDYSKLDVDPQNDKTFWFNTELMSAGRKNWVGVFQIAPNTANDVGVVSVDTPTDGALTNSETVTVTVFNYGDNPASGFNVTYQVDAGTVVSEAFVGTLASQTSAQHTFATTADLSTEGQTYAITSCTALGGDEDTGNDCTTSNVTHVAANDIGVIAFTSPVSGEGLTNETVTVTIENFGTAAQSGFDVNYIIDAGTPVVETVAATVNPGSTISYSFTATANLTTPGTYAFSSSTLLAGDADGSNDTANTTVTNFSCQTISNAAGLPIGPNAGTVTTSITNVPDDFIVDDVNVTVNINHTWDGDLNISLFSPDNTEVVLVGPSGESGDDYIDTVFDDEAATAITAGAPPYTGTFQPVGNLSDFDGLQSIGDWTLVITDNANGDGGTLNNWDLQLCGDMNLSVDEFLVEDGITIIYEENNHFLIKLPTNIINERLNLNVLNVLGQNLLWRTLENESGNGYEYRLDMSYAAAGMYFVKIGNGTRSNIKRIIVR